MLSEIIARMKPNIVLIRNPSGTFGTGIVLDDRGVIVTNSHVVENTRLVRVETNDKQVFIGNVIAANKAVDYAFVLCNNIKAEPFPVLSERPEIGEGEDVIAIGHPLGYEFTVTKGIISSARREVQGIHYIQTDVSINPGNSGGPLLDSRGEILGINTWIVSNAQGLAFTIPSSYIKKAYSELPPLADIPGKNYCIKCGHLNTGNSKYCRQCGSTFDAIKVNNQFYTDTGYCPACMQQNKAGEKYCRNCGSLLLLTVEKTKKKVEQQEKNLENQVILCPGCGTENKGKKYCINCGKTLFPHE